MHFLLSALFEDSAQSENGSSNRSSCLSNLAHTSMISSVDADASENSSGSSPRHSRTSFQTNPQTQAEQVIEANGMSFIRQFYISKGFSSKAVDIMCSSWRTGTKRQYQIYIKKWIHFCYQRKSDPMQLHEVVVIEFLTKLFEDGQSYSSLNSARSALSSFLCSDSGLTIGKFPAVIRFMKGVYELKPPIPKYSVIWDVNIVLNYLKLLGPNERLTLFCLSHKLLMLLALSTGQRAQTLHKVDIRNINIAQKFNSNTNY